MCVIIASKGYSTPTLAELDRGCYNNPDGFGWALVWQTDRKPKLVVKRTMDADEAVDTYLEAVRSYGKRVICSAFHARIATHGDAELSNCHPWRVGSDKRSVLFHNGILSVNMDQANGRSDSGVFANDVLPMMGGAAGFQNPGVAHILHKWSVGSKLVMLTANPMLTPLTIIGEERGEWYGDQWYSNSSCFPYVPAKPAVTLNKGYTSTAWEIDDFPTAVADEEKFSDMWDDEWSCVECNQINPMTDITCQLCHYCPECQVWDCYCGLIPATEA
jgi:glutamine amidotransferase